jgi:phenylpyruvate tautomerase PptA (4-oxalocrotonate tautomerase family)
MPMIDIWIPRGALTSDAEGQLVSELTDTLIQHEGLDSYNEAIREVTWVFVHRPENVYRASRIADAPIYRITPTVPEGQYTDAARASLVKSVSEIVARAEGVAVSDILSRLWIFPTEVFDGGWGSRGGIRRLPDIMEHFLGPQGRAEGERRLRAKRKADAQQCVGALNLLSQGPEK